MDRKLNELKTGAKASRIERLELLTKIEDFETNSHPAAMRNFIKEIIELEMRKQDPIQDLATVTIKLAEAEIYAIKSRFNTLEMKVGANPHESFSDADFT